MAKDNFKIYKAIFRNCVNKKDILYFDINTDIKDIRSYELKYQLELKVLKIITVIKS